MKIYSVQLDLSSEKKVHNFKKVRDLIAAHSIEPNSLIVLPEMFGTGFKLNPMSTTSGEPTLTEDFLGDLAISQKSWVIGGMVAPSEKTNLGANRAVVLSPIGNKINHYDKIHLIQSLGEDQVHLKGHHIELITINQFKVCPFICYDLRFPEIFRIAARKGGTLFVVIACWPESRIEHWSTLLRARAIENQVYVVGVNATGHGADIEYGGYSRVIDPKGKVIGSTQKQECIIESLADLDGLERWREEFPAFKQLRPEFLPPF